MFGILTLIMAIAFTETAKSNAGAILESHTEYKNAIESIEQYIEEYHDRDENRTLGFVLASPHAIYTLLETERGRAELARFANEHHFIAFDGEHRVATAGGASVNEQPPGEDAVWRFSEGPMLHTSPTFSIGYTLALSRLPDGRPLVAQESKVEHIFFEDDDVVIDVTYIDEDGIQQAGTYRVCWNERQDLRSGVQGKYVIWLEGEPED